MECIKKKEAIVLGLKKYFTGKPCKYGHVAERFTSNSSCIICDSEKVRGYGAANAEIIRAYKSKYYKKNKQHISSNQRDYYIENKDSITKSVSKYKTTNKHKVNALIAKRRATKLDATPHWLSKDMIKEIATFYMIATWYDEPYHVDHIIPLQGKLVCGLHVPWNLQVITATDNLRKGNN